MGIFSNLFSSSSEEEQMILREDGTKVPLSHFVGEAFLFSCTKHVADISDFVNNALFPPKEIITKRYLDNIEHGSSEYFALMGEKLSADAILEDAFIFYYFIIYKYVLSELKTIDGLDYSLFQKNFSKYVSRELSELSERYSDRLFDNEYLSSLKDDYPEDPHPPYHMDDDKPFPEFYKAISNYFEKVHYEDLSVTEKTMNPYVKSSKLFSLRPLGTIDDDEIGLTIFFASFFRTLKALPEGYEVHGKFYEQKNSYLFDEGLDLMVDVTWENMFPMLQVCSLYIEAQVKK
jgi:hypothetical protein